MGDGDLKPAKEGIGREVDDNGNASYAVDTKKALTFIEDLGEGTRYKLSGLSVAL